MAAVIFYGVVNSICVANQDFSPSTSIGKEVFRGIFSNSIALFLFGCLKLYEQANEALNSNTKVWPLSLALECKMIS